MGTHELSARRQFLKFYPNIGRFHSPPTTIRTIEALLEVTTHNGFMRQPCCRMLRLSSTSPQRGARNSQRAKRRQAAALQSGQDARAPKGRRSRSAGPELQRWPTWEREAIPYHTLHRTSAGRTMRSSALHPNDFENSGILETVPITRNCGSGCGSLLVSRRENSGRMFVAQTCA